MKINNFLSHLSSTEIQECLDILPKKYSEIDIPIFVVKRNFIGFLLTYYVLNKYYEDSLKEVISFWNNCGGTAIYSKNSETNKTNPECCLIIGKNKESTINILFHELRHSFQHKYLSAYHHRLSLDFRIDNDYILNLNNESKYTEQPLEKDANWYANKYCKILNTRRNLNVDC